MSGLSTALDDWLRPRESDRTVVTLLHRAGMRVHTPGEHASLVRELETRHWRGAYCGCLATRFRHERTRATCVPGPEDASDDTRSVRKWLYHCGVPFQTTVRAYYYDPVSVETTWKLFIRYWPVFLWPRDVVIVPADHQWVLTYCDEAGTLMFGTDRWDAPWPTQAGADELGSPQEG